MVPRAECEERGALRRQWETDAEECHRKGGPPRPNLTGPTLFTLLRTTGYISRISRSFYGIGCWAGRRSKHGLSDDDE
ncbi:hypothetical protein BDN67DRAFT_976085 [Paxillus ammoniavirescens]|nr:hypothetical protein BDN67DRAFT_976085 [Paxillus ammoniavirescens]